MKTKLLIVIFKNIKLKPYDIPKLRGFFANEFPECSELHNHLPDGSFSYKFPKIQYRIADGHPCLIGFHTGFDILKKIFFEIESLKIEDKLYNAMEKEIILKEEELGEADADIEYEFISPWMALNQENYKKYKDISYEDRKSFLENILRENLKTLSKGFGYTIQNVEQIRVKGSFEPLTVNFKNQKMQCFKGNFKVNFHIPYLLGVGKQSSRGFGVVKNSRMSGR